MKVKREWIGDSISYNTRGRLSSISFFSFILFLETVLYLLIGSLDLCSGTMAICYKS